MNRQPIIFNCSFRSHQNWLHSSLRQFHSKCGRQWWWWWWCLQASQTDWNVQNKCSTIVPVTGRCPLLDRFKSIYDPIFMCLETALSSNQLRYYWIVLYNFVDTMPARRGRGRKNFLLDCAKSNGSNGRQEIERSGEWRKKRQRQREKEREKKRNETDWIYILSSFDKNTGSDAVALVLCRSVLANGQLRQQPTTSTVSSSVSISLHF